MLAVGPSWNIMQLLLISLVSNLYFQWYFNNNGHIDVDYSWHSLNVLQTFMFYQEVQKTQLLFLCNFTTILNFVAVIDTTGILEI